ncbi:MAG: 16S rRNA (adenine(1518)-N(6)/adenine(1519)-N(6))-dimethyltransferase RsmA [Anaerolineae bacterium]|nr:16S rRNA (adenine(1518)-N(6)/adenine(1519)-N(6))-dimethyltransferase RsmA [Anaerolineae bacterium]
MNPKTLLDDYEVAPKKSLGQNFLHDPGALEKIAASAEIDPQDTVLEIGPGTGALTEFLAPLAKRVICVEVDERLKPILDEQLAAYPNVWVIYQDILTVNIPALIQPDEYIVVANLPYYITTPILSMLLESAHKPRRMILTVQWEVAERMIAKPDDMNQLAVGVQYFGHVQIINKLKPATFWPRPNVDSAVVRIDVYDEPPVEVPGERAFFRVVRAGFGQKRKQLKNSLGAGMGISHAAAAELLEQADIDPRRRAETLSLEEWATLTRVIAAQ